MEETKTKKPRKAPVRHEGERYRVTLVKGEGKLSFSVSPSADGYTLRARTKSPGIAVRLATEHFRETSAVDSFSAAKLRVEQLVKAATAKEWTTKKAARTIEDLF